jgi:3-deoxy-D-manno-octulosonate 8-phosphate phosphatase (KDO 8-P phosphatase)
MGLSWLLTDVDGVLTDGRLRYGSEGELDKTFHVRDGLALRLAKQAGLKVGLLTARGGAAVARRAMELGLDAVIERREEKGVAFKAFLSERALRAEEVAYVGDDLPDLPVLLRSGLSFAPSDAAGEVQEHVHRVLDVPGGAGAVRAAVEEILRARGQWQSLVATFLGG